MPERRRILTGTAAIVVWVLAAAALVTFGGTAGAVGTASSEQYKPPPPPATILTGLSTPAELAADSKGNLWFAQGGVPASAVTLWKLAKGSTTPVSMYSAQGGNGATTPFVIDIAFDVGDNPHFVVWTGSGSSHQSSLVRVNASTGAATVLTVANGTHDAGFGITSGSGLVGTEIGPNGTVYWVTQSPGASGNQESRLYAQALGAPTSQLVAEFATTGVSHRVLDFDIATDSTIYLTQQAVGGPGGGSVGVYRVASGSSPEALRVFSLAPPTNPRPIYVAFDGQENLIVGERILNGVTGPQCAASTTFRLVRFEASSLAGPTPSGAVYSSGTYPGFNGVFVSSSAYFQADDDGDVLFGLFETSSGCPTGPFSHLRAIAVDGNDTTGTQHVFLDDAPSPPAPGPAANGVYAFAFSGSDAFATSLRLGTLWRIDLNKVKKPK